MRGTGDTVMIRSSLIDSRNKRAMVAGPTGHVVRRALIRFVCATEKRVVLAAPLKRSRRWLAMADSPSLFDWRMKPETRASHRLRHRSALDFP